MSQDLFQRRFETIPTLHDLSLMQGPWYNPGERGESISHQGIASKRGSGPMD